MVIERSNDHYIVVSKQFAERYFSGDDPVGKHVQVDWATKAEVFEILGEVGDTVSDVTRPVQPAIYFPILLGLFLGWAVSAGATQLLRSMLYGTRPLDPATFAAAAALLVAVAALACLIPAWRASRIDPMQALRTE